MAITVKKLIAELQKIDNPYAEVEVLPSSNGYLLEIEYIKKVDRKVLIIIKRPKKY
jgi:hypothetical protein